MKSINSVKVVSDGSYLLDGGPFFGPVPKVLWEKQAKPDRKNRVRLGLNSLLIRSGEENILVNTGIGSKQPEINREIYGHASSRLIRNLKSNGVSAKDVNKVILTQLHFDHSIIFKINLKCSPQNRNRLLPLIAVISFRPNSRNSKGRRLFSS